MAKHFYGCIKQKYDVRDWKYSLSAPVAARPPVVDLRPKCPPVYDQGQLGSCTGNGIAGDIEFLQKNFEGTEFTPSRLFIYYCERDMEGTVTQDAGAEIRDGIKCVNTYGAPPESAWPYDVSKFATYPSPQAFAEALDCLAFQYEAVENLDGICDAIALGLPVVIGITVYDSFESDVVAKTGIVPMPNKATEQIQGGHCVVIVGYDDTKRVVLCRNSWGKGWGMDGYFTLPYAFINDPDLASDFWVIQKLQQQPFTKTVNNVWNRVRHFFKF